MTSKMLQLNTALCLLSFHSTVCDLETVNNLADVWIVIQELCYFVIAMSVFLASK